MALRVTHQRDLRNDVVVTTSETSKTTCSIPCAASLRSISHALATPETPVALLRKGWVPKCQLGQGGGSYEGVCSLKQTTIETEYKVRHLFVICLARRTEICTILRRVSFEVVNAHVLKYSGTLGFDCDFNPKCASC